MEVESWYERPVDAVSLGADSILKRRVMADGEKWVEPEGSSHEEMEVRKRARDEYEAAMLEIGALSLKAGAGGRRIDITVTGRSDEKLFVEDICREYDCGKNKAYKILEEVPSHRDGRRVFVYRSDLEQYVDEHGGNISVRW